MGAQSNPVGTEPRPRGPDYGLNPTCTLIGCSAEIRYLPPRLSVSPRSRPGSNQSSSPQRILGDGPGAGPSFLRQWILPRRRVANERAQNQSGTPGFHGPCANMHNLVWRGWVTEPLLFCTPVPRYRPGRTPPWGGPCAAVPGPRPKRLIKSRAAASARPAKRRLPPVLSPYRSIWCKRGWKQSARPSLFRSQSQECGAS
ncbi:hypothetical protein SKAU_G00242050 [Synaphobranchus kaupii]|uniref:Uncharacterized protein n=1 Tax=Synaphobranchus kaupii TaxID=118154 RepID=A0A9Q1F7Q5_SYNKA|nr:hypothetical protein SKAU_G00242050 [Synaphobranchus kaupii]